MVRCQVKGEWQLNEIKQQWWSEVHCFECAPTFHHHFGWCTTGSAINTVHFNPSFPLADYNATPLTSSLLYPSKLVRTWVIKKKREVKGHNETKLHVGGVLYSIWSIWYYIHNFKSKGLQDYNNSCLSNMSFSAAFMYTTVKVWDHLEMYLFSMKPHMT